MQVLQQSVYYICDDIEKRSM